MMRVLLIHDGSDHCGPLIEHAEHFAQADMTLIPRVAKSEEEAERSLSGEFDVVLIHQTVFPEAVIHCGKPVVILERLDGAQLGGCRKWLPHVAGVIKGYMIRPREWNNTINGRVHAHMIADAGMRAENTRATPGLPLPQLSSAELTRIKIGYGFSADPRHRPLLRQFIDFSSEREYAVHFAGFVEYAGTEIELHRRRCYETVKAWSDAHPDKAICGAGRVLHPDEYHRTMFLSRCIVSPWGWGESCHRDYEALLLGAVLIKPPMDHVQCWPQIYQPKQTYIPCRVDFADVPDIIERVNRDWQLWRTR